MLLLFRLTDSFEADERVKMQYMSYFVRQGSRDVICLYKLENGVCSKSYGQYSPCP